MTQLHTPKASRNQEMGRLSFIGSVSRFSRRRSPRGAEHRPGSGGTSRPAPCTFATVSVLKKIAGRRLPVASAVVLSLSLTAPATAFADTQSPTASPSATPPAAMSTVGGELLGRPGTQVNLGGGVPVLPKGISARSWIVADAESGDILASHNAHWRLPPASTLKMLFADTVLPKFPRSEQHKVVPSDLAGMGDGSSMVGIKEGETYSVHDLWLGVFLRSGNDAVHVLSAMNHGVEQTVKDMQQHAEELQALDTHVVSPDGYDAGGQVSSAYDLSLFARSGLQKKDFREYCSTVRASFPGETKEKGGKKTRGSFEIQNTNRLLAGDFDITPYRGIAGVKNGNTTNAGATFTGVAERDGRVLLVTVMNPEKKDHNEVYKETAQLFDWGFSAAGKVKPVGELVAPKGADTGAQPGANPSARGAGKASAKPVAASVKTGGSSGVGVAIAISGGLLLLLAAGAFLVNRRWPLPDLVRRRTRP
ncbi:D-alanyl-D-alanine carboxypeptidase [Streptomyces sp. NPDC001795]|uniref:D-alanyl-D-alanine carboxypeptidase n=1 Tax=unclassified Streptomyces TaxID=2593676 RepID=UPI00332BD588